MFVTILIANLPIGVPTTGLVGYYQPVASDVVAYWAPSDRYPPPEPVSDEFARFVDVRPKLASLGRAWRRPPFFPAACVINRPEERALMSRTAPRLRAHVRLAYTRRGGREPESASRRRRRHQKDPDNA